MFFTSIIPIFFLTLGFLVFFVFLIYFHFSLFFFSVFRALWFIVVVYCARLWPFILPIVTRFIIFTPQLLLAYCGCPSWTAHWYAGCLATTTTLCWSCHASFPDKSSFYFVFYFPCILIRIRVEFLSYQLL